VASQAAWASKPENREYYRGSENVERVRAWRKRNPRYWQREKPKESDALQETSNSEPVVNKINKSKRTGPALQDILKTQDPLVIGLIINLVDSALQEDIAGVTQRYIRQGRAIMGERPGGLYYGKTNRKHRTPAAGTVAV
jgi:membrane carboxypeptidase/penicillin-binding protein PbpC